MFPRMRCLCSVHKCHIRHVMLQFEWVCLEGWVEEDGPI